MSASVGDIREATSDEDILALFPLACELRPHLADADLFLKQVRRQAGEGYRIAWARGPEGEALGFTGFRLMETLAWGRCLYVDDLVVTEARRAAGIGSNLVDWVVYTARAAGCQEVHLDSGTHRVGAHAFYHARGMAVRAFHFSRTL